MELYLLQEQRVCHSENGTQITTNHVIFKTKDEGIDYINDRIKHIQKWYSIRNHDERVHDAVISHRIVTDCEVIDFHLEEYGLYEKGAYIPTALMQSMAEEMVIDPDDLAF
jgi:hypothetical protein